METELLEYEFIQVVGAVLLVLSLSAATLVGWVVACRCGLPIRGLVRVQVATLGGAIIGSGAGIFVAWALHGEGHVGGGTDGSGAVEALFVVMFGAFYGLPAGMLGELAVSAPHRRSVRGWLLATAIVIAGSFGAVLLSFWIGETLEHLKELSIFLCFVTLSALTIAAYMVGSRPRGPVPRKAVGAARLRARA